MGQHLFPKGTEPTWHLFPCQLCWDTLDIPCLSSPIWVSPWTDRSEEAEMQRGEIMARFSFLSSLKVGRATKQADIWRADGFFPLCFRSFILASSIWGSLHHTILKVPLHKMVFRGLCATRTAVPTSPFYTSWKSGPWFAQKKKGREWGCGFFSWLSLSPLLKAIYGNCMVSFSLQLSAISRKISSLITILLLLLCLFEGAMRWSFPDVALYESEKPS